MNNIRTIFSADSLDSPLAALFAAVAGLWAAIVDRDLRKKLISRLRRYSCGVAQRQN